MCVAHRAESTDKKTFEAFQELRVDSKIRDQTRPVGELLDGAILAGVELGDSTRFFSVREVALRNADLTNTDLRGADLTNEDFEGWDLSIPPGAPVIDELQLTHLDRDSSVITSTELDDADLTNAHLIDADLTDASLRNAELSNAETETDNE